LDGKKLISFALFSSYKTLQTAVNNNFSKWTTWNTFPLFYNTFITFFYMFRATPCSSSGSQILLIQNLLWSLSVSGRPVHRLREKSREFSLNLCTGRPLTES